MNSIIVAKEHHLDDLTKMGLDLWPDNDYLELKDEFLYILRSEKDNIFLYCLDQTPVAFIHVSIRSDYVEGTTSSPTGYIEGIYVTPGFRRKGISKDLVLEGEKWLKEKGCKQIGSDIEMNNQLSYCFHTSIGFKEVNRLIAFIKDIT